MKLTASLRRDVITLFQALDGQQLPYGDRRGASFWSSEYGMLAVDRDGYRTLTAIAQAFQKVPEWVTYPAEYLRTTIVHAYLECNAEPELTTKRVEDSLRDGFGHQRAFVPFWGLHLDDNVTLDFGEHQLRKLGDTGFTSEIVTPFLEFRNGVSDMDADLASLKKALAHIPNVPILPIDYTGASEGAREFVAPIAERVAEFLQFLAAWVIDDRNAAKIIDHRGAYFGRFTTPMPVLSRDTDQMQPVRLDTPNLRGMPYGPRFQAEHIEFFEEAGFLSLLPHVSTGPSGGNSSTAMLLRATQLFSDGERAVSLRQAIISYIGACEALFGKKDDAQLYTCSGMAATSGRPFEIAFNEALELYDKRSEAAHRGVTPETVEPARMYAMSAIKYVATNRDEQTLQNKSAIRRWLEDHVVLARSFYAAPSVEDSDRRS